MNLLSLLPKGVSRTIGKAMLKTKAASPEICLIGGLILGGGALVMVGVNTWKGKEKLQKDVKAIKEIRTTVVNEDDSDYEPEENASEDKPKLPAKIPYKNLTPDQKKLLLARRIDFGKDVVVTYGLPTIVAIGSAALIWAGRSILRGRLSEVTAVLMATQEQFRKYRMKMAEQIGDEKEQELYYGAGKQVVVNEDGDVLDTPMVQKGENLSQYAFYFDPGEWDNGTREWIWKNHCWDRSKIVNQLLISSVQEDYTRQLNIRGWVSLGEVAERLGSIPNPYWYRVGWIWKEGRDNRIELGVLEGPHQLAFNKDFMDPRKSQNVALIEPNVDGCIDQVFTHIEQYDKRCGKRSKPKYRVPDNVEMFGEDYARKLA